MNIIKNKHNSILKKNKYKRCIFKPIYVCENLFVVSTVGQLSFAQTLINTNQIKSNFLLVLYSNKNKNLPKNIVAGINYEIFDNVIILETPVGVNNITISKLIHVYNIYKNLLKTISFHNCFICSVEGHYSLFSYLCRKRNIKINLFEEGLGTYKFRKIKNKLVSSSSPLKFKGFVRFIDNIFNIKQYFIVTNFDNIYCLFPYKLQRIFTYKKINQINYNAILNNTNYSDYIKEKGILNIDKGQIFFASQAFIYDSYRSVEILFNIFKLYIKKYNLKIYIKPHPKETEVFKNSLMKLINKENLDDFISFIDIPVLPLEYLVAFFEPKILVGFSSSSLVYSKLVNKNIESHSITPIFINNPDIFLFGHKNEENILKHFKILEESFGDIIHSVFSEKDI